MIILLFNSKRYLKYVKSVKPAFQLNKTCINNKDFFLTRYKKTLNHTVKIAAMQYTVYHVYIYNYLSFNIYK